MSSAAASDTQASPAPGIGMMSLLIVVVLTVVLTVGGVAGAVLYLAKSGKLNTGAAAGAASAAKADPTPIKTHEISLEPMLVNLADADGHSYLRAGVTLRVEDPPKSEKEAKAEPEAKGKGAVPEVSAPLRDTVLDVLGRQQVTELILPDGKERLKGLLKKAIQERNPEVKLTEVYFTEFLVQR